MSDDFRGVICVPHFFETQCTESSIDIITTDKIPTDANKEGTKKLQ